MCVCWGGGGCGVKAVHKTKVKHMIRGNTCFSFSKDKNVIWKEHICRYCRVLLKFLIICLNYIFSKCTIGKINFRSKKMFFLGGGGGQTY